MASLPSLRGQRVILELPPPREAPAALDYVRRNRFLLEPLEPLRQPEYYTEDWWRIALAVARREARAGLGVRFLLRPVENSALVIGTLAFSAIQRGAFQACNLGYSLDAGWQRQGLMGEALALALEYAYGDLGLHRVMAAVQPDNPRSLKLLRTLGFREEGYAPDYLKIAGEWRDHRLFALHAEDWHSHPVARMFRKKGALR